MKTILLKDAVPGTGTNAEGFVLFSILDSYINNKEKVALSFDGASVMSTSFFNSSIGELLDKHGKEKFKTFISITMIKKSQADLLTRYIKNMEECSKKI